jgi:hypothetical protein
MRDAVATNLPSLVINWPILQISAWQLCSYRAKNCLHVVAPIYNDTMLTASKFQQVTSAAVYQHLLEGLEYHS